MAKSMRGERSGASRAFVVIGVVALVLAAILTGAWFYLAHELETRSGAAIEAAAAQGATITCEEREAFGYPFRLGLRCRAFGVDVPDADLTASAGGLRTASQLYDPARIVAELDGPLRLDTRELPPLDIAWSLAQASVRLGFSGVRRTAVVVTAPDVALAGPAGERRPLATAEEAQLHLRANDETGALDVAASNRGLRFQAPELAALPAAAGTLDLSIDGAGAWLGGQLPGETALALLGGRAGTVKAARIDFGGPNLELSGPFRFSQDGLMSGELELAVAEPERITDLIAAVVPDFAPVANQVASAIGFLGRRENGRSVLPLTVRDGAVTLGVIPLGRIPPLR